MYYPIINLKDLLHQSNFERFNFIQVGAGGNGGYLTQKLSRMLSTKKNENRFTYTIVDEDCVEEKNLQRQPFIKDDVGENKAAVLSERYSSAYDIEIYYKDKYIHSVEDLQQLCDEDSFTILIGCVDNNASRQIFNDFFNESSTICYIDAGIDGVNGDTEEEIAESGYTGQVVCGLKIDNKVILDPVGIVYDNILKDKDTILPGLSCGLTIVNYPQRMQTNEMAALILHSYIQNIFYDFKIVSHYTNFNALTMTSRPTYIKR